MDPIMEIADRHGIHVVEDAAEAIGSKYKARMCGSIGRISAFSLYGNKTITTGEGGMVVTDDDELAERVRLLKGQGMDQTRRYWFTIVGYNYRMTNIQAAIGLAQMENIEKFIAKRRKIAEWYGENLEGAPGITLPVERDYAFHSYWMYSVLVEEQYGKTRDDVIAMLDGNGVETRPFFYPMHVMPVYGDTDASGLRTATRVASRGMNLPMYYDLDLDEVRLICDCIKNKSKGTPERAKPKDSMLKEKILKVRDLESEGKDHVDAMYQKPSHRRRKQILLEIMARYVPGKDFLDIGCAEGLYCGEARNLKAGRVVGVDVSGTKIARAQELYPDLEFMVLDSDGVSGSLHEKFDFILCTEVLQHIPDYGRTLGEAAALLEESGHLLISVPNLSKGAGHVFADIDGSMSVEELLHEIGGAGYGRQNAVWKFNTDALEKELVSEFPLDLVEKVQVDTPDGEVKNLWTVFLLRKKG
jgi:2-polyprenyl-3-methyl-5-hydroxy-6-metoxy-1,4-benzoquinol methylase